MNDADVTLLVPSCDRYADVWRPFFALLRRNWPDCPYRVVLGANERVADEPDVETLRVGPDRDWSRSLRAMLRSLSTPYVLIMLEDFLLEAPVDTARLRDLAERLRVLDGAYLRLRPFPPPDFRLARHPEIGEIEPGAPYRSAMQAAFWRRESLLELLVDGESPWEFEHLSARRSDLDPRGYYSTWTPALRFVAGVTMGLWLPEGVSVCREQGVAVDTSARRVMTARELLARVPSRVVSEALGLLPWKRRAKVIRAWRSLGLRAPRPFPTSARGG
ncbi:MAG: hypothetical protein R3A52_11875 [Polyangiales bacterium]